MRPLFLAPLAAVLVAAACTRPRVAVYDAPKDAEVPAVAGAAPVPEAPRPDAPGLAWSVPAGWSQRTGSGMRLATLMPPVGGGVELSVVRLAGDAGGDLANVNRWRGQLGLAPVDSLAGQAETVAAPAGPARVVALSSADGRALLGAILQDGDSCWFFKLTGPAAAVARLEADYRSFIRSLRRAAS